MKIFLVYLNIFTPIHLILLSFKLLNCFVFPTDPTIFFDYLFFQESHFNLINGHHLSLNLLHVDYR